MTATKELCSGLFRPCLVLLLHVFDIMWLLARNCYETWPFKDLPRWASEEFTTAYIYLKKVLSCVVNKADHFALCHHYGPYTVFHVQRICLTSLTRAKWNFPLNFRTMRKLSDLYSGIFQNLLTCAKWNFPLNFRTMCRGITRIHRLPSRPSHPYGRQPHSLIFMSTLYKATSCLPASS